MRDFEKKENEGLPLVQIREEQPFMLIVKAKFLSGCVMIKGIPSQIVSNYCAPDPDQTCRLQIFCRSDRDPYPQSASWRSWSQRLRQI